MGIHHALYVSSRREHLYAHRLICAASGCRRTFGWTSVVSWIGVQANQELTEAGWTCQNGKWICPAHLKWAAA